MADPVARSSTVKELARRWRCRPARVRAMIATGKLPAIDLGGAVRITAEVIAAAEAGPLAVRPRARRKADRIDPEVERLLET